MLKRLFTPANLSLLLGLAGEVLVLLTAFGVNLTTDEKTAVLGVLSGLLMVLGVLFNPTVQARFGGAK